MARWLPRSRALLLLLGVNLLIFVAIRLWFGIDQRAAIAFLTPLAAQTGAANFLFGQFIHLSFLHIAFNMLTLASLANLALPRLGERSFALTYLGAGVVGAAAHYLTSDLPAIGASGAVSGVIGFFANYYERRHFRFILFFVIPVNLSGRNIVIAFLAINLLGSLTATSISFWSHIGGCLFGVAVAWLCKRLDRLRFE